MRKESNGVSPYRLGRERLPAGQERLSVVQGAVPTRSKLRRVAHPFDPEARGEALVDAWLRQKGNSDD
ncbi:MAG: hypothetical protein ABSA93_31805 [Streptosporangiaceae bacterium]